MVGHRLLEISDIDVVVEQPELGRERGGFGAVRGSQSGENRRHMCIHRPSFDTEDLSNLRVGVPSNDMPQYLSLPSCQWPRYGGPRYEGE